LANNSGLSPQVSHKANLSPRVYNNSSGTNLNDLSGSLAKPLYTRGKSKIGSGVIRPFQPSSGGSNHISNTLVQQQH